MLFRSWYVARARSYAVARLSEDCRGAVWGDVCSHWCTNGQSSWSSLLEQVKRVDAVVFFGLSEPLSACMPDASLGGAAEGPPFEQACSSASFGSLVSSCTTGCPTFTRLWLPRFFLAMATSFIACFRIKVRMAGSFTVPGPLDTTSTRQIGRPVCGRHTH